MFGVIVVLVVIVVVIPVVVLLSGGVVAGAPLILAVPLALPVIALGALVAVLGPFIIRVSSAWVFEVLAVCGLAGISVSALVLTDSTPYPGWAVALPVVSTTSSLPR